MVRTQKKKEDNGECCQTKEKEDAQALTYENENKEEPTMNKLFSSARTVICPERLLGRQKMYLYSRGDEDLILGVVLWRQTNRSR